MLRFKLTLLILWCTGPGFCLSVLAQDPSEIPGLMLWLDALDTITLTRTANSISEWGNKVDAVNPAIQADADKQPSLSANGLNGKAAAFFDGNDYTVAHEVL